MNHADDNADDALLVPHPFPIPIQFPDFDFEMEHDIVPYHIIEIDNDDSEIPSPPIHYINFNEMIYSDPSYDVTVIRKDALRRRRTRTVRNYDRCVSEQKTWKFMEMFGFELHQRVSVFCFLFFFSNELIN